jgi:hypothetical protein
LAHNERGRQLRRPFYMNRTMTAMAMGQSQSVATDAR